jgi:hypothetical protein
VNSCRIVIAYGNQLIWHDRQSRLSPLGQLLINGDYRNVWSAAELQAKNVTMAVGLRQCIRPSVESETPGHDGYPLAFVLINWTAWMRPFPIAGFESAGETHCHLYFPPADLVGTLFPKQRF